MSFYKFLQLFKIFNSNNLSTNIYVQLYILDNLYHV